MEKGKKNIRLAVSITLWALAVAFVILTVFASEIWGDTSLLSQVFGNQSSGLNAITSWVNKQLPVVLRSLVYLIIVYGISRCIRLIISKLLNASKKGRTASKLIDSFLRYFTGLVAIVVVLLIFGVDPVALFASVGILSLIVGLGAQSLISDIISGLFIVFEKEYEVGDYIVIDGFRGKVESIGIRTTQIVDGGGNNKIVNNSEITSVVNLSYDVSLVSVDVPVPYDDFKHTEEVIKANAEKLKKQFPKFTSGPEYVGPISFGNDGISIKFVGKIPEESRFSSERDLRRAIFAMLEENNIEIPFVTYNVNQQEPKK